MQIHNSNFRSTTLSADWASLEPYKFNLVVTSLLTNVIYLLYTRAPTNQRNSDSAYFFLNIQMTKVYALQLICILIKEGKILLLYITKFMCRTFARHRYFYLHVQNVSLELVSSKMEFSGFFLSWE